MMASGPRAVIGVPLYNHAPQLVEAIESLLMQSYRDLRIVAVDDGSSDESPAIIQCYAAKDPRLLYFRNEKRLGYIGNARRAYELARVNFPGAEFFAWGSDHDVWNPHWLKLLIERLESEPYAFMASSWVHRIEERGEIVRSYKFVLPESHGPFDRVRSAAHLLSAGMLIYGLFRVSTLDRTPGLRPVLVPDRLLLAELSAYGQVAIVPEYLWYRRYGGLASRARQRRNSFPAGPPLYTYCPIGLQHFSALLHEFVIRRRGKPEFGRVSGLLLAFVYLLERNRWVLTRSVRRQVASGLKAARRIGASARDRIRMVLTAAQRRTDRHGKSRMLLGRPDGK